MNDVEYNNQNSPRQAGAAFMKTKRALAATGVAVAIAATGGVMVANAATQAPSPSATAQDNGSQNAQGEHPRGDKQGKGSGGEITAVNGNEITVKGRDGQEKKYQLSDATAVKIMPAFDPANPPQDKSQKPQATDGSRNDLVVGKNVRFTLDQNDTTKVTEAMVGPKMGGGEVTAVNGNEVTVKSHDNQEVKYQITDAAKVYLAPAKDQSTQNSTQRPTPTAGSLTDITVAKKIRVAFDQNDATKVATVMVGDLGGPEKGEDKGGKKAGGEITAINGSELTVKGRDGQETKYQLNDSTQYLLAPARGQNGSKDQGDAQRAEPTQGSQGDLAVGKRVRIVVDPSDATKATKVMIAPAQSSTQSATPQAN